MLSNSPKNFLFVSIDALISDIAWQVSKEGNEVRYFIENVEDNDIERVGCKGVQSTGSIVNHTDEISVRAEIFG